MRQEDRRRRDAAQDKALLRFAAVAAIFAATGAAALTLTPGEPALRGLQHLALFAQPARGRSLKPPAPPAREEAAPAKPETSPKPESPAKAEPAPEPRFAAPATPSARAVSSAIPTAPIAPGSAGTTTSRSSTAASVRANAGSVAGLPWKNTRSSSRRWPITRLR